MAMAGFLVDVYEAIRLRIVIALEPAMYRIPVAEPDPKSFTADEQRQLSVLITKIKDALLAQKGYLATPVHYRSVIQRSAMGNGEQYGLLAYRQSPLSDRRQVLINKEADDLFTADFHVQLGQLTEDEKLDPQALEKRQAHHRTGLCQYRRGEFSLLEIHIQAYLLDGYLPVPGIVTD